MFKPHCFPINESFYKFQCLCQSRRPKQKLTFQPFYNYFLPSPKNIILNGQQIIYTKKEHDICHYNPRFIMSSGFMFYGIIMNEFSNKSVKQHVEVVDSYFTINRTTQFKCKEGHFNMFV